MKRLNYLIIWILYFNYFNHYKAVQRAKKDSGTNRMTSGGSWFDIDSSCTVANRNSWSQNVPEYRNGFRVVRP